MVRANVIHYHELVQWSFKGTNDDEGSVDDALVIHGNRGVRQLAAFRAGDQVLQNRGVLHRARHDVRDVSRGARRDRTA
mgnify:CR=1 FL=1